MHIFRNVKYFCKLILNMYVIINVKPLVNNNYIKKKFYDKYYTLIHFIIKLHILNKIDFSTSCNV